MTKALSIFRLCINQADTNGATLNIDDASVYDLDRKEQSEAVFTRLTSKERLRCSDPPLLLELGQQNRPR